MKKTSVIFCTLLIICSQMAFGQVPQKLSYQGMLTDTQGNPVANGNVELTCRLYDAASGGSLLWSETQQVAVTDGLFDAILGSGTPLNLPFDTQYWLGLSVDGGAELTPRTELTAAAYSLQAQSVADGAAVRSLNSLTDDVTILAGSNIQIQQAANSLIISATTGGNNGTSVVTDATLSGDGTTGSPLAVAVPLSLTGDVIQVLTTEHDNGTYAKLGSSNYGVVAGNPAQGSTGWVGGFSGVHGTKSFDNGLYNYGLLGSKSFGVYGKNVEDFVGSPISLAVGNYGYLGSSDYGAFGKHYDPENFGALGTALEGVYGENGISGNLGSLATGLDGVYGKHGSSGNWGYLGGSNFGAFGINSDGTYGYLGGVASIGGGYGAYGVHANGDFGILGGPSHGVFGKDKETGNYGYLGSDYAAVRGWNFSGGNSYAGSFVGNVEISGSLSKGGGSFKIDHPLDPANKYLAHSFVESPDMMNVYNGNMTTDGSGYATVTLPDYFRALNRDFRYQLTVIGEFAQAIVGQEIQDNQFVIRTDKPNIKVSWQVTGIRRDRWAEANRIAVEEEKTPQQRGYYLHPNLFGQTEERSVDWARNPEMMRALQEMPAEQAALQKKIAEEQQQRKRDEQRAPLLEPRDEHKR